MRLPYFPFYVNDWLTSTKRRLMTLEQQAAYLNLMANMWDDPDCSLPNDPDVLAVLSELNGRWNENATAFKQVLHDHPTKDGYLTNDRLLAEHQKASKGWKQKSNAGKKSAKARAKKAAERSNSVATDVQRSCNGQSVSGSVSGSIDLKGKESAKIPPEHRDALPLKLRTPEASEAWQNFLRHRSEIGEPMGATAISALSMWLEKHKWSSDRFCAAVLNSMANGYKGLIEERPDYRSKKSQTEEIQNLIAEFEAEEAANA